jgi:hypothetical protein
MEIVAILTKMDDRLARQDEILAQLATMLGKMDDRMARQDERQDARLAKQDDTVRLIATHMDRLGEFMASCHHEAAAAHQTTNVVMTRLAEQAMALTTTLDELRRDRTRRP